MKGQISFESLFIMLIVLSSGMYITNMYLQTHDITVATAIARTDFVEQVNSMESQVIIDEVKVYSSENESGLEADVFVTTYPSSVSEENFDSKKFEETAERIINSTKFVNVVFHINAE